MTKTFSRSRALVAAICLLGLSGCADMTDMQQRMVSGGVGGAVVGTVATAITGGCIPCGTVIGAAVGTAGGYVVDQIDKYNKSGSSNSPSSNNTSSPYSSQPSSGNGYYNSNPAPSYSSPAS